MNLSIAAKHQDLASPKVHYAAKGMTAGEGSVISFHDPSDGRIAAFKVGNVAQELHQTREVLVLRYLFERRLANFDFFSKLRTILYPPNMAPIGAKLWENAFQAICKFSFCDAENFF